MTSISERSVFMDNANKVSCPVIVDPNPEDYDEKSREYQGCPSIAMTKNGRIFVAWYAGGFNEPHMDNYNLVHFSDDNGKTWSQMCVVIPSSKELQIHALDIQLWVDPEGVLHIFWVQNNVDKAEIHNSPEDFGKKIWEGDTVYVDGYSFGDYTHAEWEITCENPDADKLVFSNPRYLFDGFLRCKPTVLKNGAYLYCNYAQIYDRYAYSLSYDKGQMFEKHLGGKKIGNTYDETMAYQRKDETIVMLARTEKGYIAESVSKDGGKSFGDGKATDIPNPNSRFYVAKLPSGRVLLINNDHNLQREVMTAYLSEDDGVTWKYKNCINFGDHTTYPDADAYNDTVYLVYDHDRTGAKEIIFCKFTEEDIINGNPIKEQIISKAYGKTEC